MNETFKYKSDENFDLENNVHEIRTAIDDHKNLPMLGGLVNKLNDTYKKSNLSL